MPMVGNVAEVGQSALSFNLFSLMRQLLHEELANHRAITIRRPLYAMATKLLKLVGRFLSSYTKNTGHY